MIDGDEEAELELRGALSGLAVPGEVVVCDIGGGSTEIIVGSRRRLDASSVELGDEPRHRQRAAVRAPRAQRSADRRASSRPRAPTFRARWLGVRAAAAEARRWSASPAPSRRSLRSSTGLVRYDAARVHGARLERTACSGSCSRLAGAVARPSDKGCPASSPRRADVIVTGAAIAAELLAWSGAEELVVSDRGVRWGLVLEHAGAAPTRA